MSRLPLIVTDVAHNADGLRAALGWTRSLVGGSLYVLFGTMRDKALAPMLDALREADATVLPVALPTPRAVPQSDLREAARAHGLRVLDVADAAGGLAWFRRHASDADGLLITGSHLTAAAGRAALRSVS